MTISVQALQVPLRLPLGVIGLPVDSDYLNRMQTLVNSDPQALQTYTVLVATGSSGHTYIFSVDGEAISYVSATTNKATIAQGLLDAFNVNPYARGKYVGSTDGVDTITLVAVDPDIDLTVSDSDAYLTTTETVAAASAAVVNFGRVCVNLQTSNDEGTPLGCEVYAAKLQAQVDTLTVAYTSGKIYLVTIVVDEQQYDIPVVAATDLATLTTALVTDINNAMPANAVLAASSVAGTITLTAEVAGKAFTTGIGAQTTPGNMTIAHTVSGPLTDINTCFAGISTVSNDTEVTVIAGSTAAYAPNSGFIAMLTGKIYVENSQSPTTSDRVYVETLAGSNEGKVYNDSSATRLLLSRASWQPIQSRSAGSGLAIVELS